MMFWERRPALPATIMKNSEKVINIARNHHEEFRKGDQHCPQPS
jgi:hypothetical protein